MYWTRLVAGAERGQGQKGRELTLYLTSGFSASLSSEMEESASGGRMSTRALEWRCRATLELGFRSSLFRVDRIRT